MQGKFNYTHPISVTIIHYIQLRLRLATKNLSVLFLQHVQQCWSHSKRDEGTEQALETIRWSEKFLRILSLQRAETSCWATAVWRRSVCGRGWPRWVILIACCPVSRCGRSRGVILIGAGSVGGGAVLSLLGTAMAVSGGVTAGYRGGWEEWGWRKRGGREGTVQWRWGGGHEGTGLEAPQQLLVVPAEALLLSALLLNGFL